MFLFLETMLQKRSNSKVVKNVENFQENLAFL